MSNPILEQLNSVTTNPIPIQNNQIQKQQLKQAIQQFRTLQNPQQALLSNPNLQKAISLIKSVGSPQQVFAQLAAQRGLTADDIKDIFS